MGSSKIPSCVLMVVAILAAISAHRPAGVEGANILGVFTAHSPSGLLVHMSVVRALAEVGHNVTVISSLPSPIKHSNIQQYVVEPAEDVKQTRDGKLQRLSDGKGATKMSFVERFKEGYDSFKFMLANQAYILKDNNLMDRLNSPHTSFDLVIVGYFYNDYLLGLAAKFDCPVILSWPAEPMELLNVYVGNPTEITYVPNMNIGIRVGDLMTFSQRFKNLLTGVALKGLKLFKDYQMSALYDDLFQRSQNPDFPSFEDMQKRVSLVFVNHHFSEGPVRPNVPALIEMGGIQLKDRFDEMPADVKSFLQDNENGTILVSLGSNVRSADLDRHTTQILFKVLSSLPQKVIWKWENVSFPGHSPNILFRGWLPQQEILAHPNIKLFITHAGKGSVIEAEYLGVPMLALPFYADQPGNAEKLAASGYGRQLNPKHLTEHGFREALNDILTNSTYATNVQHFAELYSDRPMRPTELVVYWSEYVMRYGGAQHMQSPLVHLNALQSNSIDVFIFSRVVMYAVWRFLKFAVPRLYRRVRSVFKSKVD